MTRMRRARRRGMSLVEMMFVLAVLGILMSIGVGSYRRMQVNNLFTNEVERLEGEIRNLAAMARSIGDIQPAMPALNNETLRAEVNGGAQGWRWRTIENGKVKQEGWIGRRQHVFVRWSNAYNFRQNLTKGVWLEMGPPNGAALMQVIFEPDGTPVDPGSIVLTNRTQSYTINITRLGSVQGL